MHNSALGMEAVARSRTKGEARTTSVQPDPARSKGERPNRRIQKTEPSEASSAKLIQKGVYAEIRALLLLFASRQAPRKMQDNRDDGSDNRGNKHVPIHRR